MNGLLGLLLLLVQHAPAATPAAVKLYADIAHGEGGLGKVQKAVNDLAAVVNAAVTGEAPSAG